MLDPGFFGFIQDVQVGLVIDLPNGRLASASMKDQLIQPAAPASKIFILDPHFS
jgi:hypothetical protein